MGKITLILLFSLLILIGLRWYVAPRGLIVDAGKNNTFPCIEYDSKVFHRRKPNCSGWGRRGDKNVYHVYNKLGLRDNDYEQKAKPGVKRILLLGSSNLAGPGLSIDNTVGSKLNVLAKKNKLSWQFINAATDAYFTLHSRIKLPEYISAYRPHVVAHYLAARNGIFTDAMLMRAVNVTANNEWQILRSPWDRYTWLKYFIPEAAPLSERWFQMISLNEQLQRIYISWKASFIWLNERERLAILLEPTVALLKDMQIIAERGGAKFIVIWNRSELVPDQHVPPGMDLKLTQTVNKYFIHGFMFSSEAVTQYLRSSGLPLLEIWDPRLSYEEYRLSGDFHWNERGVELFSQRVLDAMKKLFADNMASGI